MKKKSDDRATLDRRGFLKGAATGAGAMLVNVPSANARAGGGSTGATGAAPAPTAQQIARDSGNATPTAIPGPMVRKPGSDLMVETLKELGIEYVAANPG